MKLSSDGQTVLYATFLGGSAEDDMYGIALNSSGEAYVVGSTQSTDFPVTPSAFQPAAKGGTCGTSPCSDAFVTVLTADGSGLVYSTYLGGSLNDAAFAVAVDSSGAAYLTGFAGWPDFPTTPGALQTTFSSGTPPFVSNIDPTKSGVASLVYSTFLGGNDVGRGRGIAVNPSGEAFVTGLNRLYHSGHARRFSNNSPSPGDRICGRAKSFRLGPGFRHLSRWSAPGRHFL